MNAILKDLSHLGPYERLQLVEDLWDSIDQDTLPAMTDATYDELTRRAASADKHPEHNVSIEQIAVKLGVRLC